MEEIQVKLVAHVGKKLLRPDNGKHNQGGRIFYFACFQVKLEQHKK